jgi:glucosyl-3-phosphoglycerate synthase
VRSFHFRQFSEISALLRAKESQGQRISVVIPTLQEEETIGAIVAEIVEKLIVCSGLVDELIVVDSGSTDRTREIAAAAGAQVFLGADIAPELGDHPGKGENLWKSQFVSTGNICVFIDGDIRDFHEGFVCGLIGPLLECADVDYVKAFYRRPLVTEGESLRQGGGRVSELLMRPLFSLFYPLLCALHQPLAGEYAVRRTLLERLPFPHDYAVETAHLIDTLSIRGIGAFAQCDLETRHHRNRPLDELGEMACAILRFFLQRAERDGLLQMRQELGSTYIRHLANEQGWHREEIPLSCAERPPFATLTTKHPRS